MRPIIIEGPDGAGKTFTFSDIIGTYTDYNPAPRACTSIGGPLIGNELIDYLRDYGCAEGMVYDRHPCISGLVYDAVFAREVRPSVAEELQKMFRAILDHAIVIYCRPPMENIINAVHQSPQMAGVTRSIYRIVDTYDSLMQGAIPHIRYDWTCDDLPSL